MGGAARGITRDGRPWLISEVSREGVEGGAIWPMRGLAGPHLSTVTGGVGDAYDGGVGDASWYAVCRVRWLGPGSPVRVGLAVRVLYGGVLAKAQAEAPTICVKRQFYFRYTYSTASVRKCFHAALSRYGLQPSKSMRLNVM